MKVVSFKYLAKKKKNKKHVIFCTKKLFKPLLYGMGAFILLLVTNLFVNNFFVNIKTSLQNFVESFISMLG